MGRALCRSSRRREHAEIARKIFRLTGEQLSLLQPDNLPPGLTGEDAGAAGGAERSYAPSLDALRQAISSRIQVRGGGHQDPGGHPS